MARARKASVKRIPQPIVDPGMVGAEDYLATVAGSNLVMLARATLGESKGVIDEVIAAQARSMTPSNASLEFDRLMGWYTVSLWIYVAVRQIATNLAMVPLVAEFRKNSTGAWEAQPDSDVQELLDNPVGNRTMPQIIETWSTFMETCGTDLIVAEREHGDPENPDTSVSIIGFTPLRPSRIWIDPGREFVERYRHVVDGVETIIAPENAELTRYAHPLSDYWGLPPMSVLMKSIAIDGQVEDFSLASLEHGGVPDVVLETDKDLGRIARRYKYEFERQYMRPGKTGGVAVLDAGLKLKPVGVPPKDMQFQDTAKLTMQRIMAAYGVPPLLAMDMSDASVLANAKVQLDLFYRLTLRQKGYHFEAALTKLLRATYGPYWRARFAFEQVDATKDHDLEQKAAREDYREGVLTRDEARARQGLPPAPDGDGGFKEPPEPKLPPGAGAFGKAAPIVVATKPSRVTPELKAASRAAYRRQVALWQPRLTHEFREFFAGQRDRVLADFRKLPADLLQAMPRKMRKAPDEDDDAPEFDDDTIVFQLFNLAEENAAMFKKVGPVFLLGMVEAGNDRIESLKPSTQVALRAATHSVQAFYQHWGATKVNEINTTTRDAIRDVIAEAFEKGQSNREIEAAITAKFNDLVEGGKVDPDVVSESPEYRLERIARTETATMLNAGSFEGTKELVAQGARLVKSWLSARDNLTRDSHAAMDAETSNDPIPVTQRFANGLMYPNDPAGPAEEVINCRCSLIELIAEEGT